MNQEIRLLDLFYKVQIEPLYFLNTQYILIIPNSLLLGKYTMCFENNLHYELDVIDSSTLNIIFFNDINHPILPSNAI